MNNLHLFELINAPPGLSPLRLVLATSVAHWGIGLIPLALAFAWLHVDHAARRELVQMLMAVLLALGLAQIVTYIWPQPRPLALHLGVQYLELGNDPGLPSEHVTVFWTLALSALSTRRFAVWAFPLLAAGLLVGWSRVFLGVHFPFDILAAFPVSVTGAVAARGLRRPSMKAVARLLALYDRLSHWVCSKMHPTRDT